MAEGQESQAQDQGPGRGPCSPATAQTGVSLRQDLMYWSVVVFMTWVHQHTTISVLLSQRNNLRCAYGKGLHSGTRGHRNRSHLCLFV
jgi:hypothetical protein